MSQSNIGQAVIIITYQILNDLTRHSPDQISNQWRVSLSYTIKVLS